MKFTIPIIIAIALLATCALTFQPEDPKWPETFTADFREEFDYTLLKRETTGTIFFDFPSRRYKISRENGHWDRYCGANGLYAFYNTPCDQLTTTSGDRYLYYPEYDDCCFCCDAEHGCSILKREWLSGAEFLGEVEVDGFKALKWD